MVVCFIWLPLIYIFYNWIMIRRDKLSPSVKSFPFPFPAIIIIMGIIAWTSSPHKYIYIYIFGSNHQQMCRLSLGWVCRENYMQIKTPHANRKRTFLEHNIYYSQLYKKLVKHFRFYPCFLFVGGIVGGSKIVHILGMHCVYSELGAKRIPCLSGWWFASAMMVCR